MNGRIRIIVGAVLIVAIVGLGWLLMPKSKTNATNPATSVSTAPIEQPSPVNGFMGSDKEQLIADKTAEPVLLDNGVNKVDFKVKSQFEITAEDVKSADYVWHSSQLSVDVYKQNKLPFKKESVVVRSPLVLIANARITDAMIKAKMVEKVGNTYFLTTSGMSRLATLMLEQKPWTELEKSLPYYGPVTVGSCDPKKTSSGMLWYTVVGTSANGGKSLTAQNIGQVLPKLKAYYDVQGSLPSKNKVLTQSFLKTGDYPIIATFESELQEWALTYPGDVPQIKQDVRMIYPRPTIWSDHTFLAITDNGVKLAKGLESPEFQTIAWERHGFRTGLNGIKNDPALQILGVPAKIDSVIPIPKPEAMRVLREQL